MTGRQAIRKYGIPFDALTTPKNEKTLFESQWMTLFDIPDEINQAIRVLPNRVYCNKDMVIPLTNAFKNLIQRDKASELRTWDGCYNPRPIRGFEKQFNEFFTKNAFDKASDYISMHSWGVAIDVNAGWNQLGRPSILSPEFVKCFTDAGFIWGGTFPRVDGMHFELK
jgi:hypothetical protein